jgi:DNA-binding IclR family transcriptional regulator
MPPESSVAVRRGHWPPAKLAVQWGRLARRGAPESFSASQHMETPPHKTATGPVMSLVKALEILELFTEAQELGIREIARVTGFNRSTVHRILATFQKHGYLVQNPSNRKFRLAVKFLKLGSIAVRRFDLRDHARPYMRQLARELNESIFLHAQESPASVVCIDEVLANRTLGIGTGLGIATPVHAAAAGKLFLAHQLPEEVRRFLSNQRLAACTERTILDPERLMAEIAQARQAGYALNNEESEIGARYIAVPIYGHDRAMIGALNVGAPIARLTDDKIEEFVQRMKRAANDISSQM